MKRKTAVLSLLLLAFAGSFVNFYMTNLILSDVSNMFYGLQDAFFITSLPGFTFACHFVLATLYVFRVYRHPEHKSQINKRYAWIFALISLIGLASVFISKFVYYKGCQDIYPFSGYLLIFLIYHLAAITFGLWKFIQFHDCSGEPEKRKSKFSYHFYTVILCVLVFFAYDRFGALLWSPVYVQWRTLYLTYPFYISLLLPLLMLFLYARYYFGAYDAHPYREMGFIIGSIVLNAVLCAAVFIQGASNTQFVSAISPALAIERLATIPIDTIVHFTLVFIFGFYKLFHLLRHLKKHNITRIKH